MALSNSQAALRRRRMARLKAAQQYSGNASAKAYTPLSGVDLMPILLDRKTGEYLAMFDVQSAQLTEHAEYEASVKIDRIVYKESDRFCWRDRNFDLYLVKSVENMMIWTRGIGIRQAWLHRSQVKIVVDEPYVTERLWIRGEGIVYLDGEPWQRFMTRRFPLNP